MGEGAYAIYPNNTSANVGSLDVYPESFGARGNDPTFDDGPAIAAALNAAAVTGGAVQFRRKTYHLLNPQNTIEVPDNARIRLNGATILVAAVAGQDCIAFRLSGVDNVEISDGTIEGTLDAAIVPNAGYGIYIDASTGVDLTDLELLHHWFDGVFIAGLSSRVSQTRVRSHHNRRAGCSIIGGTKLRFEDGAYTDTGFAAAPEGGEFGINIETEGVAPTNDVLVTGCELARNGTAGNNTGSGFVSRRGVTGTRPSNVRVVQCAVKDNELVGAVAVETDRVIFSENPDCSGQNGAIVAGDNQYALGAFDCTDVVIAENEGSDNSRFIFVAGCDGVDVADNIGRGRASAVMGSDYDGITVRNQGVPSNTSNRTVRVANNTVEGFGGHGIVVTNASSADVSDNTAKDNGRHGIYVAACPNAWVTFNASNGNSRETNATYSDIFIDSTCDNAIVFGNVPRFHDKYVAGTVQAPFNQDFVMFQPATTPAVLDDWFVDAPLYLTGGTGAGQARNINDYDTATKRADVNAMVPVPDATTTYAVRWPNIVHSSIRIAAGSTGVRVTGNDVRPGLSGAISDAGTATVIANNTPGDFGSQPITTTGALTAASVAVGAGFVSFGAAPASAGKLRGGNDFSLWVTTLAGTPRVIMELSNLAAGRFTLDIGFTVAAVVGVRIAGNGATVIETGSNTTTLGFFGVPTVARQNIAAAANDLATVITLANSLRTAIINLGLGQ